VKRFFKSLIDKKIFSWDNVEEFEDIEIPHQDMNFNRDGRYVYFGQEYCVYTYYDEHHNKTCILWDLGYNES
jgi:hypothetical protein